MPFVLAIPSVLKFIILLDLEISPAKHIPFLQLSVCATAGLLKSILEYRAKTLSYPTNQ